MADRDEPRTIGEARLDAQFGALYHSLNARFYRRLHRWILALKLAGGTAAFSLLFEGVPPVVGLLGAGFISALVIVEAVWKPLECAFEHEDFERQYSALLERPDLDTLDAFDRALAAIHDEGTGIEALSVPAYNRNVVSAGYESYARPLTRWQRILSGMV